MASRAKRTAEQDMAKLRAKWGDATVRYHSPEARRKLRERVGTGKAYRAEMQRRRKLAEADKATR